MRRTAFPGIAEAWISRGDGTQGVPFAIGVISFSALCDLSFIGDAEALITFAASCSVDTENIDVFVDFITTCIPTFLGDVPEPIIVNNTFVSIIVSDP